MKVCYVIGPIRGRSKSRIRRWINVWRGRNVAIKLWKAGFAVVCPHLNSLTVRRHVNEDKIVDRDLEILSRCDFAVIMDRWSCSEGSRRELAYCAGEPIRIYFDADRAIKKESKIMQ